MRKTMKKEIINYLSILGVDARYVSLYGGYIFVNNLKFSRFSRKREELFQSKYPECNVVRSKVFQKMCIRASRNLSKTLNPGDKILVKQNGTCMDLILYLILEPYTRKYGIEIIPQDQKTKNTFKPDSVASSLTLDQELGKLVNQMFSGEKIKPSMMRTEKNGIKVIYPLINIPDSWICAWAQKIYPECKILPAENKSKDLIEFLENYVPDVRENMLKSAIFANQIN